MQAAIQGRRTLRRAPLGAPAYALLALCACGSAAPADESGTGWLVDQYFDGRQTVDLPDLQQPISVAVGLIEPGRPAPEGSPVDYTDGAGIGDAMGKYYPFLHSASDAGTYAVRVPAGDMEGIVRDANRRVRRIADFVKGAGNFLHVIAVGLDGTRGLADAARAGNWRVVYSTPGCVVAARSGAQPNQRFTTAFVGDKGPVWDLNDKATERCALAGVLQAFGIAPARTMSRADSLYPHQPAPHSCPLAAARGAALDRNSDWRNPLRCKSRARAAWPFEVLRRAAATGRLKAGPVSRTDFTAALAAAAQEIGEDRRNKVLRRENAMLETAGKADIPAPMTR